MTDVSADMARIISDSQINTISFPDVCSIHADVLEVLQEGNGHIQCLRLSGIFDSEERKKIAGVATSQSPVKKVVFEKEI